MPKNEIELYKPVSVVHMKGNPTLQQRKAWNWMVKHSAPNLLKEKYHQIPIRQLKKWLGHTDENKNYDDIYQSLLSLMTTVVEWNVMERDTDERWKIKSKEAMTMLSYIHIENGICTYAFFPLLAEKLSERLMYIKINLQLQNRFSSVYGLVLYEFLKTYYIEKNKKGLTPKLKLKQFRDIIGVKSKEYADFRDFNKYVIKPAIKEVNEKSDISTQVTLIKESRKVVALQFEIFENRDKEKNMRELNRMIDGDDEMGLVNDPAENQNPILKTKLEELNFGEAQINKFLTESDREKVLDCVDYVLMRLEKGANIKDLTAYLNTILEMHREGGLDISAVEDWRTQQRQKQSELNQQMQDQTQQEIEEAQDKIKQEKDKKLIQEFKESNSEIFEKICEGYLEELEKKNKIIFNRVLKKSTELNQTLIETVKDYSMTSSEIDLRILEKIETVNS